MRIAEYKQTGTRTEQQTVRHPAEYDEFGEIVRQPWDEVVDVEVPVMGVVYRDMTPEEIKEWEDQRPQTPQPPTLDERVGTLETRTDDTEEALKMILERTVV